jgi:hypothetical protein
VVQHRHLPIPGRHGLIAVSGAVPSCVEHSDMVGQKWHGCAFLVEYSQKRTPQNRFRGLIRSSVPMEVISTNLRSPRCLARATRLAVPEKSTLNCSHEERQGREGEVR